jgi:tetratricopeptide (TPR) repeat protein
VRISYHPRWQSRGGERVWLVAPSFMLVFPKSERLELFFGGGPPVAAGQLMTLAGCLVFLGAILPVRRRLVGALRPALELPPLPALARVMRRTGEWSPRFRRQVLAAGLGVVAIGAGLAAVVARASDADGLYRQGQVLYNAGRLAEAAALFHQAQQLAPLSSTAIHSTYFEGISLYRQDKWADAEVVFRRLLTNFPEAHAAAESMYHVGICRARLGDPKGAAEVWAETERRFADTPWAGHARARLDEMSGTGRGG